MIVEVAAFLIIVGTLLVAAGYFIGEYKARKERGEFDESDTA